MDSEGDGGGGRGGGTDAHVLNPHLLEVELRFLRFYSQYNYKDNSKD